MKLLFLAAGILFFTNCFSQKKDTVLTSSTLTRATVYYGYGAELEHNAKATLITGMQQVIISGIALTPDMNTIQIGAPENVIILSSYHRIYTKPSVPVKPVVNDTIKGLQKQLAAVNNEQSIQEDLLRRISALIENNFVTPDKKEIPAEEIIKLTEYYAQKVKTIKEKQFELQLKAEDLNTKIRDISTRLANIPPPPDLQSKPVGQLILQVMTKGAATASFDIAYFTRNAGWIPSYELRMKTIDNSLKLVYKASVTQSTGLDWNNVRLSLSTSNPNQGNTLPVLSPSYLQLYVPKIFSTMKRKAESFNTDALNDREVKASSAPAGTSIEEMSNIEAYTTLKESLLNINFEIDLPYDIPSDNKAYSVAIKEEKINATLRHYAIPKLDKDAFLIAEVTRWDSLNLLPGDANIIMDNVYLGKSFIDPNTTKDTLSLSMGRDKRIAIKRTLVKELKSTKERADLKIEQFTWEIVVKNNKKQPVTLILKDQYPVSKVKEMEVIRGSSNGEVDEETGIITWNIKLQPGESKKIRFSYTVKYPKDKMITGL